MRRPAGEGRERRRLEPASVWLLLAALGGIVLVAVPTLGAEPWQFRPGHVGPAGPFAWLVRATDGEWNVTAIRAAGLLAGVVVALAAVVATVRARWPRWAAITLTCAVCLLLSGPAVASRRVFASRPRLGFTRTIRRIRSSSPVASCGRVKTHTATTMRIRGSSASTRSTAP